MMGFAGVLCVLCTEPSRRVGTEGAGIAGGSGKGSDLRDFGAAFCDALSAPIPIALEEVAPKIAVDAAPDVSVEAGVPSSGGMVSAVTRSGGPLGVLGGAKADKTRDGTFERRLSAVPAGPSSVLLATKLVRID